MQQSKSQIFSGPERRSILGTRYNHLFRLWSNRIGFFGILSYLWMLSLGIADSSFCPFPAGICLWGISGSDGTDCRRNVPPDSTLDLGGNRIGLDIIMFVWFLLISISLCLLVLGPLKQVFFISHSGKMPHPTKNKKFIVKINNGRIWIA